MKKFKRLLVITAAISMIGLPIAFSYANCPSVNIIKCSSPMKGTECSANTNPSWAGYPIGKDHHDTGVDFFMGAVYFSGSSNKGLACLYIGNKGSLIDMFEGVYQKYKRSDLSGNWYRCNLSPEIPGINTCCMGPNISHCKFKYKS